VSTKSGFEGFYTAFFTVLKWFKASKMGKRRKITQKKKPDEVHREKIPRGDIIPADFGKFFQTANFRCTFLLRFNFIMYFLITNVHISFIISQFCSKVLHVYQFFVHSNLWLHMSTFWSTLDLDLHQGVDLGAILLVQHLFLLDQM
jgi:hypothetical protein